MSELRSPSVKLPEIGRGTSTIEDLSDIPLVPISPLVMTGKFPDGLSLDPGERIVVDVLEVYGKNESGKFTAGIRQSDSEITTEDEGSRPEVCYIKELMDDAKFMGPLAYNCIARQRHLKTIDPLNAQPRHMEDIQNIMGMCLGVGGSFDSIDSKFGSVLSKGKELEDMDSVVGRISEIGYYSVVTISGGYELIILTDAAGNRVGMQYSPEKERVLSELFNYEESKKPLFNVEEYIKENE